MPIQLPLLLLQPLPRSSSSTPAFPCFADGETEAQVWALCSQPSWQCLEPQQTPVVLPAARQGPGLTEPLGAQGT